MTTVRVIRKSYHLFSLTSTHGRDGAIASPSLRWRINSSLHTGVNQIYSCFPICGNIRGRLLFGRCSVRISVGTPATLWFLVVFVSPSRQLQGKNSIGPRPLPSNSSFLNNLIIPCCTKWARKMTHNLFPNTYKTADSSRKRPL
jgi:hypothetical protein